MKIYTMFSLLLVACGGGLPVSRIDDGLKTPVVEMQVVTQLRTTLATWPTCTTQAQTPVVWEVLARSCTHQFCGSACCNTCRWFLVTGDSTGITAVAEPSMLGLPSEGLECEATAVSEFLGARLLDLDAHCVVQ